ncbi:hypothetical protein ANCDUO_07648 [Ancylostoma duodenale]|uniref:Uncharacterized protein n=1 Tax=Ancylostoma duodenale TaxID=51022 RepID=A0A0C2DHX3_9BILA|nr:hypothetical protein ANCDUO_07648 [Ancylostoma duodenale]
MLGRVVAAFRQLLAINCAEIATERCAGKDEIDDIDVDDPTAFRRRREANGYVRISERLDLIFMTFFITLVTIPVIVLFYLS